MTNQKGFAIVWFMAIVYLVIAFGAIWGWIWNIVKIIHSDFATITGMLVCRIIGVFVAPLGAVLGFF